MVHHVVRVDRDGGETEPATNGLGDLPSRYAFLTDGALAAAADYFPDGRRDYSRRRQIVITANPALQERELLKLARLAAEVGEALRRRGVSEPTATIAAQSGLMIFSVAFAQWIDEGEDRSFGDLQQSGLVVLKDLAR